MTKGLFITFEGVDGCGKSTQMKLIAEKLRENGIEPVITREPGGCPISEQIRALLLDVNNKEMNIRTEVLLYAAARVQHIKEVILPAIRQGKIVLCDRFLDSSLAYQGYGRQLGEDEVLLANSYAKTHAVPDLTLFFACPPESAFHRMNEHKEMDRLEQENMTFFSRTFYGYESLAGREPERIMRIDALGAKQETHEKAMAILRPFFEKHGITLK